MVRNIKTYVCPFDLHDHEDSKIYHKTTLKSGEDERYNLLKDKV